MWWKIQNKSRWVPRKPKHKVHDATLQNIIAFVVQTFSWDPPLGILMGSQRLWVAETRVEVASIAREMSKAKRRKNAILHRRNNADRNVFVMQTISAGEQLVRASFTRLLWIAISETATRNVSREKRRKIFPGDTETKSAIYEMHFLGEIVLLRYGKTLLYFQKHTPSVAVFLRDWRRLHHTSQQNTWHQIVPESFIGGPCESKLVNHAKPPYQILCEN